MLSILTALSKLVLIGCLRRTFVQSVVLEPESPCDAGDLCIDIGPIDLLKNVRRSLIDPDTPQSARTKKSASGKEYKLVVSASAQGSAKREDEAKKV